MKRLSNDTGAALIWAIILLMILSSFAMAVIFISSQNNREILREYDVIRAGYIAEAGIELGYHTLMSETGVGDERYIQSLSEDDFPLTHTESLTVDGSTIGSFAATITAEEQDGIHWVVITSTGTLANSNRQRVRTLKINRDNLAEVIRHGN